jgi:hypothetical protein
MFRRKLGEVKELSWPIEETSKGKRANFKIHAILHQTPSHEERKATWSISYLWPSLQSFSMLGAVLYA